MKNYTSNTRVKVIHFTRQFEDNEVVIGNLDKSIYLVLTIEALELLDNLALGMTIGEVQSLYQQKYNEIPELQNFLENLEKKEFIESLDQEKSIQSNITKKLNPSSLNHQKEVRYHFSKFPQKLAQDLFSGKVLIGCSVLISLALIVLILDLSIIPGWEVYFFNKNLTLMRLILVSINYATIFLHEMAHLVAARAVGVSCRMRFSNRMWYLVAETDMTGIWGVPRNLRYLPLIAGSVIDAASASLLILIIFAYNQGLIFFDSTILQILRAILLTYLVRILWQFYFFMRTDFYFAIANYFRCKSLMKDTETFFYNQISRYYHKVSWLDQSYIPASEMRVIRWYTILWIFGRVAAISTLLLITIPLFWRNFVEINSILGAGYQSNIYAFTDALSMAVLILFPQFLGFVLWIRSFQLRIKYTS